MLDAKICGHERDALRFFCAISDLALRMSASVDLLHNPTQAQTTAAALRDPAKLATIIAELMRERGLHASIEMDRPGNRLDVWVNHFPNDSHPNEAPGIGIRSCRRGCFGERVVEDLDMPKARAFALALLDTPNATALEDHPEFEAFTDDALRALEATLAQYGVDATGARSVFAAHLERIEAERQRRAA